MDHEDIAGYRLRRKLGSGSAGTVWQVRDLATGRNAILKRIPISAIPDQEKLREDLAILQRIRHPHIARLLDFRETDTEWLLVSQYAVAGSLNALLKRRGLLSPGELVTLLVPLAEALDHLHRSGLTHGALTPSNTLFDADGRPLLTDASLHCLTESYREIDDLQGLATLSHRAGADPEVFTPELFTATPLHDLPRRLLTIAAPAPIDLAFPRDQSTPTTNPPNPTPPPDDDPIEHSRTPLTPPPPKPFIPEPPEATRPDQPPPPKPQRPTTPRPRTLRRRPNVTRRTPTPPNPASRPTRPTQTPAPLNSLSRGTPRTSAPAPLEPLSRVTPPTSAPALLDAQPYLTPPSTPEPATAPAASSALPMTPALTARLAAAGPPPPATATSSSSQTSTERAAQPERPRPHFRPWRHLLHGWRRVSRGDRTLSGPRERRFQPAYGVLAAAAAGAVVVLIIGVATLGFLHTASNQAAAGEHQRSTPSQSIATPPTSGASASAPAKSGTTTNPTASTPSTTQPRQPQPEPTTAASADTAAWTRTLQSLDAQRAKAFWTLDVDALDNIYVPGSNAWQADRALLTTYRKQQIRVQGLRINIESTTVTNRTPTTVTLKTTDHLTAGQAVDHTGTRTPFPPGEPTTRLITLTTSTPRATSTPAWRIATITRA